MLGILLTVLGVFAFKITNPDFQTSLVKDITKYLSDKLGSKVHIGRTEINFFNSIVLTDVLVMDRSNDTLLYTKELSGSLSVVQLFKKRYVIERVAMEDPTIYLHRNPKDEDWNFQFIIDAFGSKSEKTKQPSTLQLDLKNVQLNRLHFVMFDEPNYTRLDFGIPLLNIDMKKLDLNQPIVDIKQLLFDHADLKIEKLKEPIVAEEEEAGADTGVVHINTKPLQLFITDFELRDSKFAFAPDFPADFEICPAAYDLRTESRCAFSRRMMVRS